MLSIEERIVELEIRYTHQNQLVEDLSLELFKANEQIRVLQEWVKSSTKEASTSTTLPPNEKPPHY